jgi:hypothetical protein
MKLDTALQTLAPFVHGLGKAIIQDVSDDIARLRAQVASTVPAVPAVPVAYLDVGAGGYLDLGTDLDDSSLKKLPFGRHMLGIIGTFGVEGYTAAPQPAQQVEQPRGNGNAV